jgi:hypothetical protein
MEDSLVDSEQALEEAMEATVTDLGALAVVLVVALAVTREVGRSNARAHHIVAYTNNRVGAATSSKVIAVTVVVVTVVAEAHVSAL